MYFHDLLLSDLFVFSLNQSIKNAVFSSGKCSNCLHPSLLFMYCIWMIFNEVKMWVQKIQFFFPSISHSSILDLSHKWGCVCIMNYVYCMWIWWLVIVLYSVFPRHHPWQMHIIVKKLTTNQLCISIQSYGIYFTWRFSIFIDSVWDNVHWFMYEEKKNGI